MFKKIAGVFRAISGSPHPKNFTSAVIAAAGSSVRFGGETTKQMTYLCGAPLIVHTLLAFEACDCIHEIIIVAKKNEIDEYDRIYTIQRSVLPFFYVLEDLIRYIRDETLTALKTIYLFDLV